MEGIIINGSWKCPKKGIDCLLMKMILQWDYMASPALVCICEQFDRAGKIRNVFISLVQVMEILSYTAY